MNLITDAGKILTSLSNTKVSSSSPSCESLKERLTSLAVTGERFASAKRPVGIPLRGTGGRGFYLGAV